MMLLSFFVSLYAQYVEAENLEKAMEKSDPRLYNIMLGQLLVLSSKHNE